MPIGLKGNSDGSGAIQIGGSDAISISTGLNTTFAGTITATGTVAGATGTLYPLVSGTAVASTSGTAIDFTGIPSWVKRITVMFDGVSKSSTSNFLIQLGDSGGAETTGYIGNAIAVTTGPTILNISSTAGFPTAGDASDPSVIYGSIVFSLLNSNTWVASGVITTGNASYNTTISGRKTLSATLDRVRITTVNGTDTFDAGTINILYE